jgi:hypothetical protein
MIIFIHSINFKDKILNFCIENEIPQFYFLAGAKDIT